MTNAEIIFKAEQALAEAGKIRYTGRVIGTVTDDEGNVSPLKETEAIHTYKEWQNLGMQVQKGQKAVAKFKIWMYNSKPKKLTKEEADTINSLVVNADGSNFAAEGQTITTGGRYYMKEASFFAASQVAAIA